MNWKIISTERFQKEFKKHKKDQELLRALENKIQRLKKDPYSVGARLSGNLHGYKSTRIVKNFRLIFRIDNNQVILSAIDHRKFDYKGFDF